MSRQKRNLKLESLERRRLLAADLHNFLDPADVNADHAVSPVDALVVINHLNNGGSLEDTTAKVDVNDDSFVTPLDALQIVNQLNAPKGQQTEAWLDGPNGTQVHVELQAKSTQLEFSIRLVGAPPESSFPVLINGTPLGELQTDTQGRGKVELEGEPAADPLLEVLASSPTLDIVVDQLAAAQVTPATQVGDDSGRVDDSAGGDDSHDHTGTDDVPGIDDDGGHHDDLPGDDSQDHTGTDDVPGIDDNGGHHDDLPGDDSQDHTGTDDVPGIDDDGGHHDDLPGDDSQDHTGTDDVPGIDDDGSHHDDLPGDDSGKTDNDRDGKTDDSTPAPVDRTGLTPIELEARFARVGNQRMKAKYEVEQEHGQLEEKFKVEIKGATPGAQFDVIVAGEKIATVTADSRGKAKVEFKSRPESDDLPLPSNLPVIGVGTPIQIGAASSTFQLDD